MCVCTYVEAGVCTYVEAGVCVHMCCIYACVCLYTRLSLLLTPKPCVCIDEAGAMCA